MISRSALAYANASVRRRYCHYRSGEIVSPILSYEDIDLLQRIVQSVHKAGARADDSTGIHIHVDGSQFEVKHLVNLVRFIYKQERLLEHVFAAHANRVYYCKAIDEQFMSRLQQQAPRTLEALSEAWYGGAAPYNQRRHESRYHGRNLHSFFYRRTLEFRYFNGTLDAEKPKPELFVQLIDCRAARSVTRNHRGSRRSSGDRFVSEGASKRNRAGLERWHAGLRPSRLGAVTAADANSVPKGPILQCSPETRV